MSTFSALVARRDSDTTTCAWEDVSPDFLMDGDVTVRVSHTTINYKDGLALTGKAPIIRKFPLIPGIDFSGHVESSSHADYKAGDQVILNGWGVGEKHHGGYAELARVSGDWLVACPAEFSGADAMAIGTAGYTAMLCVMALEKAGVSAQDGLIAVTGAAGGVGSIAVAILAKLGFEVVAFTGRKDEAGFLRSLGAKDVRDRAELSAPGRPLDKETWAGAIDVAGSHTLANLIARTSYGGAVVACGLAQGMDLRTTVMPFILRGVSLVGIDSVMAPKALRELAWQRLVSDLPRGRLGDLTTTRKVADVQDMAPDIMAGKIRGRVVLEFGETCV